MRAYTEIGFDGSMRPDIECYNPYRQLSTLARFGVTQCNVTTK